MYKAGSCLIRSATPEHIMIDSTSPNCANGMDTHNMCKQVPPHPTNLSKLSESIQVPAPALLPPGLVFLLVSGVCEVLLLRKSNTMQRLASIDRLRSWRTFVTYMALLALSFSTMVFLIVDFLAVGFGSTMDYHDRLDCFGYFLMGVCVIPPTAPLFALMTGRYTRILRRFRGATKSGTLSLTSAGYRQVAYREIWAGDTLVVLLRSTSFNLSEVLKERANGGKPSAWFKVGLSAGCALVMGGLWPVLQAVRRQDEINMVDKAIEALGQEDDVGVAEVESD